MIEDWVRQDKWLLGFNNHQQRYQRNDAKKKTKGVNKYGRKIKCQD